jgi:hypothetical protein
MKKLLPLLIVAGALPACNNTDSDTTLRSVDSSTKAAADTIKASFDTAAKKGDSMISATVDSVRLKLSRRVDSVKKH